MQPDEIENIFEDALYSVSNHYFTNSERTFTYELYYHLRNTPLQDHIVVDAELPKRRLTIQEAEIFNLRPLGRRMSPDIIIHERENGNNQLLVAEVKAQRYLSAEDTIKDINKLISLRVNYNFQIGIFVAINVNIDRICNYIHQNMHLIEFPLVNGIQQINDASNIKIFVKENVNSVWETITLLELV